MNTGFARGECRRVSSATSSTERARRPAAGRAAPAPVRSRGSAGPRPINGRLPPGRGRCSFTTAALMALEPGVLVRLASPTCARKWRSGVATAAAGARKLRGARVQCRPEHAARARRARGHGGSPRARASSRFRCCHFLRADSRAASGATRSGRGSRRPFWRCHN